MRKKIIFKIASATENLERIRDFITTVALKFGFDDVTTDQIALAVDEACTNVIKHAHKFDKNKHIELHVETENDRLVISISDTGNGFEPDKLPKPNLSKYIREQKRGGLGIHLMRTLMDNVEFHFNKNGKNQVILTKYLRKNDTAS